MLLGAVLLTNFEKMKVTVNQDNTIQLEEVFNSIVLKTKDGEEMAICMRDSGFEFKYQGKWYFAKEGFVEPFKTSIRGNYLVDQKHDGSVCCPLCGSENYEEYEELMYENGIDDPQYGGELKMVKITNCRDCG